MEFEKSLKDAGLQKADLVPLTGVHKTTVYKWGRAHSVPLWIYALIDAWAMLDDEGRAELMARALARKKAGPA